MNDLWNFNWIINCTPLILAANDNRIEIADLLLKQEGIDINSIDILNQELSWNLNSTFLIILKFIMIFGILI